MRTLAIPVLLVVACGCNERQAVTAPSSATASIQGRVVDFRTQTPLAGAAVQFVAVQISGDTRATTDASGAYAMTVQGAGTYYTVAVDGAFAGTARVNGSAYRGDLLVDRGSCLSRYGTVADARTLRSVGGATVAIGTHTATSGRDGWYRIDLGCPSVPNFPGTVLMTVTHPSFPKYEQIIGRGVQGVRRIDIQLERP